MLPDMIVFGVIAAVVAGSAIGMLVSRNAVYSALFLVLNFASVALIYLLLGAPFIALTQVTVYAGAIMVLFLFVIMMLQGPVLEGERQPTSKGLIPLIAIPPVAVVIMVVGWVRGNGLQAFGTEVHPGFGTAEGVARLLLGKYLLAFELISVVLLVAIIGALAIGKGERKLPWK